MERLQKEQVVVELKEVLRGASSCIAMDFSGVTMGTFTPFRKECARQNVKIAVVKNSLAKIAVKDTPYEGMTSIFKGMTCLVCTMEKDQVVGAKITKKYADKDKKIILKGGMLDGRLLSEKEVEFLAQIPGKEELQGRLLATMLAVPQTFVRLLAAYKEKLEENVQ